MTRPRPSAGIDRWPTLLVVLLASLLAILSEPASAQDLPGRQVVMFGVLATPGSSAMDPKISPVVQAQLRKSYPNCGFKLIQVKSQRVATGQSMLLNLGDGFEASAQLLSPLDPNGKVQMKFGLNYEGTSQFQSVVLTPADQFNYFDKMLPNNSHLLIGVGAR